MTDQLFSIRLTASAERDLQTGLAFYRAQEPGLGEYFLDSLISDIDSLCISGGIHPKSFAGFHRALSKRFPYAIYYEFDNATAYVVAVLDCRQHPNTTRKRLNP